MTFRRALPVAAILAALVLAFPPLARAAVAPASTRLAAPMSNARLLQAALRAVCDRLVAEAPITPGSRVALRAEGAQPLDADAAEALLQALNARRIECVLLPPVAAPADSAPAPPAGARGAAASAPSPASGGLAEFSKLQEARAAQVARADSIARAAGTSALAPTGVGTSVLASGADGLPVIAFRIAEARVDYVRQFHGGLFGAIRIERRATARLGLRLANPGSVAVSWSASADTSIGDVVMRSELAAVEDRQRPETRPVPPNSSGLSKVVEPVLVVVLIAGLVSLFYQNRP